MPLACSLLLLSLIAPGSGEPAPPPGFVAIFNGHDLAGWRPPAHDGGHWKVVDGVIDYDAGSEEPAVPGVKDEKSLWSEREYGNYILQFDWRIKEAPFLNRAIPYILPDGSHAKGADGKPLRLALPDADSGVFLRKDGRFQVNIWCWPIGSGELYSIRTDPKYPPEVRAAATPATQADKPVGEWNHFEITVRGQTVAVVLNGQTVIKGLTIPDLPSRGPIAFQHHGARDKDGNWTGPPSLVQFRNIFIRELPATDPIKAVVITGGHDHDAAFFSIFGGIKEIDALPILASADAFKADIRGKVDVAILYDFTRDLPDAAKQNLRAYVEAGGGVVVLHHALLDFNNWDWWTNEAVGGSYRLSQPSSGVRNDVVFHVQPVGDHPIVAGLTPFTVTDEAYNKLRMAPKIRPLLATDQPASDPVVAWLGPDERFRVVAIQLGHGRSIFAAPSYRTLIRNAVVWAAGRAQ